MRIDLGAIHTEPIENLFQRWSDIFTPDTIRYALTQDDIKSIDGYMTGVSKHPHVMQEGALWFQNAFLARLHFLETNLDVEGNQMHWMARDEQRIIDGFTFFRFVRVGA